MKHSITTEPPILSFKTIEAFAKWLEKNHTTATGIWLRFFKKDSGEKSINYNQALDEALCYGWIDGQLKKYDERSWVQKFTPRKAKSLWSKRNTEHVERLTALGKMKPPGLSEVERAKHDGRWAKAYDPPSKMQIPDDFKKLLDKNKTAKDFFDQLNKANKYAIAFRLQTARKPETREKWIQTFLGMLAKKQKFH